MVFHQPQLKNMRKSNWIISPGFGVKIKTVRNHHPDKGCNSHKSWETATFISAICTFCRSRHVSLCRLKWIFFWILTNQNRALLSQCGMAQGCKRETSYTVVKVDGGFHSQKVTICKGHDKPIHGSCTIYFPGGIQKHYCE